MNDLEALRKTFRLECQITEQESCHERDMAWLRSMYMYEAERREGVEKKFGVAQDLLTIEQEKSSSFAARFTMLEAEKKVVEAEKERYKRAYEDVLSITNILIAEVEKQKREKKEEEEKMFSLIEDSLAEPPPTVQEAVTTSRRTSKWRRIIQWCGKRLSTILP